LLDHFLAKFHNFAGLRVNPLSLLNPTCISGKDRGISLAVGYNYITKSK
jgi:hypothetical protein